ncbi:MAG: transcriptional regulator [Erysipelothrix sp.]|nr:transcriptional regulator [Erysipelothrix sp.]
MKLIFAIVSNDDVSSVTSALTKENFSVTRQATSGGFLRSGNTTIIIGTEADRVSTCIDIIDRECQKRTEVVPSSASYDIGRYASFPIEVQVGGATVFVIDVEQFHKL